MSRACLGKRSVLVNRNKQLSRTGAEVATHVPAEQRLVEKSTDPPSSSSSVCSCCSCFLLGLIDDQTFLEAAAAAAAAAYRLPAAAARHEWRYKRGALEAVAWQADSSSSGDGSGRSDAALSAAAFSVLHKLPAETVNFFFDEFSRFFLSRACLGKMIMYTLEKAGGKETVFCSYHSSERVMRPIAASISVQDIEPLASSSLLARIT